MRCWLSWRNLRSERSGNTAVLFKDRRILSESSPLVHHCGCEENEEELGAGNAGSDPGEVVTAVSRTAGSDCGSVWTGRRQTAGTFFICFKNTFTLIVRGC